MIDEKAVGFSCLFLWTSRPSTESILSEDEVLGMTSQCPDNSHSTLYFYQEV